jgi:hypothetical protein
MTVNLPLFSDYFADRIVSGLENVALQAEPKTRKVLIGPSSKVKRMNFNCDQMLNYFASGTHFCHFNQCLSSDVGTRVTRRGKYWPQPQTKIHRKINNGG